MEDSAVPIPTPNAFEYYDIQKTDISKLN